MKRLAVVTFALGLGLTAFALSGTAATHAAKAPQHAKILIRHQVRGCHSWSVNGGAFRASQSVALSRGGSITFTNLDVMPHKLIKTAGPAVRFVGHANMNHMQASLKVVFPKAGLYRFKTKPGEDYMSGMKTIGEDNVLRLTVKVS